MASKFDRLLLVLNILQSRPGVRARELAEEAGVSVRTIFRDIVSLASRYPILSKRGYRLMPSSYIKNLAFTPEEYSVIQLALTSPALLRPDLIPVKRSIKAKIEAISDPNLRRTYKPINLHAPSLPLQDKKLHIIAGTLTKAITNRLEVKVFNADSPHSGTIRIQPYYLVYHHPHWIVICYYPAKRAYQALQLDLLDRVAVTNKIFQNAEDFSLQSFFSARWGFKGGELRVVKIRLNGSAARLVLSQRNSLKGEIQTIAEDKIEFKANISGTEEFLRWVLGFGSEAEVLEPRSLRDRVAEVASKLSKLYSRAEIEDREHFSKEDRLAR